MPGMGLFHDNGLLGDATTLSNWIEAAAEHSMGFPQHLHSALAAQAETLAESNGVATPEGLRLSMARATERRDRFHRARLTGELERYWREVVDVVRFVADAIVPVQRHDLEDEAFNAMTRRARKGNVDDAKVEAFANALIHNGVFQFDDEKNGYDVPIPSFRNWILRDLANSVGVTGDADAR